MRPRTNSNGARAKSSARTIPLASRLFALYSDYLHEEYGALDCDCVFVNLWADPRGAPMTYSSVNGLVRRLRARTGIEFTPHVFRHTFATELLRRGVAAEAVRLLLGHASVSTTVDRYSHLDVEDLRAQLHAAGAANLSEEIL